MMGSYTRCARCVDAGRATALASDRPDLAGLTLVAMLSHAGHHAGRLIPAIHPRGIRNTRPHWWSFWQGYNDTILAARDAARPYPGEIATGDTAAAMALLARYPF